MIAQEVAKKYAHALFMAAKDRSLIDAAYEQLEDLKAFVQNDRTLLRFLGAPQVLQENKLALVRSVFGARLEQLFIEFLVVLIEKHRAKYLAEIIDEFLRLVEAENGIGRATVITAVPLTDQQKGDLIQRLAAKTDLTIQIDEKIDPKILGGMIVILHNEIIDGSVRHGLNQIGVLLGKVKVV